GSGLHFSGSALAKKMRTDPDAKSINDILRSAGKKSAHVFDRDFHQSQSRCASGPCKMRRDQAVFGSEQRMLRGRRLSSQDIQARTGDSPCIQRISQCLLVNQLSSTGVQQESGGFHPRQPFRIHQLFGFGTQWTMEANHVALAEKSL